MLPKDHPFPPFLSSPSLPLNPQEKPMPEYDKDGRPIIDPEIVNEEKYQSAWSEKAFLRKLPRAAKKLGRLGLRQALRLY